MDALIAYLPEDRVHALAGGRELPERAWGSVLFADISGFTPLTEALTQALGHRAGIEALTGSMNAVYAGLTAAVARWRGSVISFSGDAITCWFDEGDGPAAPRAAACALALQAAMAPFAALALPGVEAVGLALKVAVASGPASRFVVGNPAIQLLDILAGATVDRMAAGEHLASPREVLLDAPTAAALGPRATLGQPVADPEGGAPFTPLLSLAEPPPEAPWEPVSLPEATLRPWLLPFVWQRHTLGLGEFLTELRPAVALFLRFTGLDFDGEAGAGERLDAFIRRVQNILASLSGTLLQISFGDKGAYLFAAFGAPMAHEDDAPRAARAALALHAAAAELGIGPIQIGISQGLLRCGAYGGPARHTYGVLGDDTNLAARLMVRAAPGETLLSGRVQAALGDAFILVPRPPMSIKGKAEPLLIFALSGVSRRRALRLQEAAYTLPMIGREHELALAARLLEDSLAGQGRILSIVGEAGIGKSRFVAEVVRLAQRRGFAAYGGTAVASGAETSYLVWRPVFQALLGLDPEMPPRRQIRWLQGELEDRVPDRAEMLPLLEPLLELPLPENDVTAALDPRARKGALEALLLDLLAHAAREAGGLLLVLEDLHWLDHLGADLLEVVARAAARLPIMLVLVYRPLERADFAAALAALPYATELRLGTLDAVALEGLVRARLAQLYPARLDPLPRRLTERLLERSQGNPFYTEELLNYLHDRGVNPYDPQALEALALPNTLHRLVLARIDQLSEYERTSLRVASIVGRLFLAAWLPGFAPELGEAERVRADLERLAQADLTPLVTPEPELTYVFKHVVTQEVAYTSLPETVRRRLHEQLARWLEESHPGAPLLDLLAFHYERSANAAKCREYLRRAGDAARAAYANEAALAYYTRLLPLLSAPLERAETLLLLGRARVAMSRWADAGATFAEAAEASRAGGDRRMLAEALSRRGHALEGLGDYPAARDALHAALALAEELGDAGERLRAERYLGGLAVTEGRREEAARLLTTSLGRARDLGDRGAELSILINLGNGALETDDLHRCEAYYLEALALAEALGDRWHMAIVLANLGEVTVRSGRLADAQSLARRSIQIDRSLGNHAGVALTLANLAEIACTLGEPAEAVAALREALPLSQMGGGLFVPLWVLCVVARAQLLFDLRASAASLLGMIVAHPGSSEYMRAQARDLASGAQLALDAPALTLEAALAAAERWLAEAGGAR